MGGGGWNHRGGLWKSWECDGEGELSRVSARQSTAIAQARANRAGNNIHILTQQTNLGGELDILFLLRPLPFITPRGEGDSVHDFREPTV